MLFMESRRGTNIAVVVSGIIVALTAVVAMSSGRAMLWSSFTRLRGRATVERRLAELTEATRRMRGRGVPAWVPDLYRSLQTELAKLSSAG